MSRKSRKPKVKMQGEATVQNMKDSEVELEGQNLIKNGFGTAFLGYDPTSTEGVQLSQVTTLFKNNRWYLISNMRQVLSQMYVEHGLIQTLIDIPVDDALRGGIEIRSQQISEDDIKLLEQKMEREEDLMNLGQAMKWVRLFGGGGIIIDTDQRPEDEFKVEQIKKDTQNIAFIPVDLWELFNDRINIADEELERLGSQFSPNKSHYNYYGQKLHESRVMRIKGRRAPSFVRKRLRGWGYSEVEGVIRSVNQYLKATGLSFEVLDEFKIDVFKMEGLQQALLTPKGEEAIRKRMAIANSIKNYQSAIIMDGGDDYQQKQLSFTGIAEVMDGIRKQIASDLRIPMTKLFGISSAGFNSGEDDIENYNAMVESQVRSKIKFEVRKVIEIRCQQLFGMIPEDLDFEFKSLRVMSSTDEQTVKTQIFNRLLQARQAGEISPRDFKEGCNKAELFPNTLEESDETFATAVSDTFEGRSADYEKAYKKEMDEQKTTDENKEGGLDV